MRNFLTGVFVFGVILLSFWLQMNLLNEIPLFGYKANVGIALTVTLSILCGQGVGISVGITYGILSDILFGKTFGLYTLLFFMIGFFVGKMSRGFSKENKTAVILIVAVTTFIFEVLLDCLLTICHQYDIEIFYIIKAIVFESLYNMLIARLLFRPLSSLAETINKGKRSYYLL